jgi:hypothetical protein
MSHMQLSALCSLLGVCSPVLAGSVLELTTAEFREDPPLIGTVEISTQDGMSRMEVTSVSNNEAGAVIFRDDVRQLIALDHEERQYYVLDEAGMQQMASQVNSAMQQMQQALADLPPEQRAMAEQMMKQHIPVPAPQSEAEPAKVQKTGDNDTINGFACEYYEVTQEGRKIRDLCVTDWDSIEGGREAAESMLAMADFFDDMAKAFADGSGMDVMGDQRDLFAHMRELDGYPVLSREFDDLSEVESESILKSAKTRTFDAAFFSPPEGYSEMDTGF